MSCGKSDKTDEEEDENWIIYDLKKCILKLPYFSLLRERKNNYRKCSLLYEHFFSRMILPYRLQ